MIYVLMSAYKCGDYIKEQIDSIFSQNDVNVRLWIRDDGSPDDTWDILQELAAEDKRIKVYTGENKGYAKSFMDLVSSVPADADFYAFCDQDDVWKPDKLLRAQKILETKKTPYVYCATPDYVDANLNPINADGGVLDKLPNGEIELKSSLFTGLFALGCTFVWNQQFHLIFKDADFSQLPQGHDNLISVLAVLVGGLYHDDAKVLWYRQHGNNTAGNKIRKRRKIDILKHRLKHWGKSKSYEMRKYILVNYHEHISKDNLELLRLSVLYRENIIKKIRFLIVGKPIQLNKFFIRKFMITVILNQY